VVAAAIIGMARTDAYRYREQARLSIKEEPDVWWKRRIYVPLIIQALVAVAILGMSRTNAYRYLSRQDLGSIKKRLSQMCGGRGELCKW
jgi:hypothetical protein